MRDVEAPLEIPLELGLPVRIAEIDVLVVALALSEDDAALLGNSIGSRQPQRRRTRMIKSMGSAVVVEGGESGGDRSM